MSASSMKVIRNRIKSVSSTMQITRAMELVASSKLHRAMERSENAGAYFEMLRETLKNIAGETGGGASVYTREREGKVCRVVIAGDRGMAGGYNHKLFKSLTVSDGDIILPIGKKAAERFDGADVYSADYVNAGKIEIADCRSIAELLAKGYENGEFTRLTLSYTRYVNALVQESESIALLPLKAAELPRAGRALTIYEPDAETALSHIVPYCLTGIIYGAVAESVTSELSARRNAMKAATDNASELADKLRLEYNSARQAAITQELTEIISAKKE